MSQDYEFACQRAELLGLAVPSEEEWLEARKAEQRDNPSDEIVVDELAENLDHSDEGAQRISGGLDELNSILSGTQKKLNRLKTICGSLNALLKVGVGSRGSTPVHKPVERAAKSDETTGEVEVPEENIVVELSEGSSETSEVKPGERSSATSRAEDLNRKMGSHLDKLDSLISKAENAQHSMHHQNKQMRKFLK